MSHPDGRSGEVGSDRPAALERAVRSRARMALAMDATRPTRPSLDQLYAENVDTATRFAYLITGDRDLADELVQDAFVRLLGRFAELRHPDSFVPYLRRTIVNLAKNQWRRRAVERVMLQKAATQRLPVVEPWATDDELWGRILMLPARQRAAIVIRYYEDLSEVEVAESLGCSVGAAKKLISRGLANLRAAMEGSQDA